VDGVEAIDEDLQIYDSPDGVSGLQGAGHVPGPRPEILQRRWTPAFRLVVGFSGLAAAAAGLRRRGILGGPLTVLGAAAILRAATNQELIELVGGDGHGVRINKTININAPVEAVYTFWSNFENFPSFMHHVREVKKVGENEWHWTVLGPAKTNVQWDAVVTQMEPNRVVGWKTKEGARIQHSGVVRFSPNARGGTQIDIQLSYNPGAGALGHAVAKLLGFDPKHKMDDDLIRMKNAIETGKLPRDAARKTNPV
jgi:uncharacterized membrane protein